MSIGLMNTAHIFCTHMTDHMVDIGNMTPNLNLQTLN